MARYRRLTIGDRPIVLSFPHWLNSDNPIRSARKRLAALAGPHLVTVDDLSVTVLVLRAEAFADTAIALAFARLADELTVWRLASDDGRRSRPHGHLGVSNNAHHNRHYVRSKGVAA